MNRPIAELCLAYCKEELKIEMLAEEMVDVAFKRARSFYLAADEQTRYAGALAAVIEFSTENDMEPIAERIIAEITAINDLSTAIQYSDSELALITMSDIANKMQDQEPLRLLIRWKNSEPKIILPGQF